MGELVVGSAGRRNRDGPWRSPLGPWIMAQLPPRCKHGAELFLPGKSASMRAVGTTNLGTEGSLCGVSWDQASGLRIWEGRWVHYLKPHPCV